MAHKVKIQTINYKGAIYNKGLNSYNYNTALYLLNNCKKIVISAYNDEGIHANEFNPSDDISRFLGSKNRIWLNKCGQDLYALLYV